VTVHRLLFFPDYLADPVWEADGGGMVSLDDLPVGTDVRASVRAWSKRWEQLAKRDMAVEDSAAGTGSEVVERVSQAEWEVLERGGRQAWQQLQAELGDGFLVGWAHFDGGEPQVEWIPGAVRERRP
jgi:hypothetical protein